MPAGFCALRTSGRGPMSLGELLMADQQGPIPGAAVPGTAESCWLCGIRVPVYQLVADGGRGCADIRWYCRDVLACTARWTARPSQPLATRPGSSVGRLARRLPFRLSISPAPATGAAALRWPRWVSDWHLGE